MSGPGELERRTRRRLAELEAGGLRRRLAPPRGIDFSSNDYLALARDPRLARAFADAALREGTGSTASRLLRGEREEFSALERRMAAFLGAEAALLFATGWAANLGLLAAFLDQGDVAFSDERNHASLIDGMRLGRARRTVFPHRDVDALARLLRRECGTGQAFVVTESLFSMDGDEAPLRELAALCRETGAALVVDEAHAVGVFGATGAGLIEESGSRADVFLSVLTGGKALGAAGAFVAGPAWAIDWLIQRARPLVFSTAPPPALAAALQASLDLVANEPERRARVLAGAALLRALLGEAGLAVLAGRSPVVPVLLGDHRRAVAVAARLQAEGFDVRAIRPPTVPPGTARLRVSVHADHDEATLRTFARALVRAVGAERACPATP